MMKKVITVIICLCLTLLALPINTAAAIANDKSLYIISEAAPDDATAFARDQFAHLHAKTLINMGFSAKDVENMRLAPAFKAYPFNESVEIANYIYHYPVVVDSKIVAILKVTYFDEKYNYQLEMGGLSDSLNELMTSNYIPAKIILSENAYYSVTDKGTKLLETFSYSDETEISKECDIVNDQIMSTSTKYNTATIIEIDNNVAYPETVQISPTVIMAQSTLIAVPLVDNSYRGLNVGVCWAASIGSLADFMRNHSMANNNAIACMYRDLMVDDHLIYYPNEYGGYDWEFSNYMYNYAGYYVYQSPKIDWQTLTYDLFVLNRPCLVKWVPFSGGFNHMVVLCGAEYETSDPYNESYWRIAVMDPNHKYTVMGYNDVFIDGSYVAYWDSTFR